MVAAVSKSSSFSLQVEVRDSRRRWLRVPFTLESTVGEVRNAVNAALPSGFSVAECELVPSPFCHYASADPETFRGPTDDWRLIDVCFEQLCLALDKKAGTIYFGSLAPLGPDRRVGLLFPDSRDDVKEPPEGAVAAELLAAARTRKVSQRRLWSLVLSLATLEDDLRNDRLALDEVRAVAGFGFDGMLAALVFCGCLSFDDALNFLEATEPPTATEGDEQQKKSSKSRYRAYSRVVQVDEDEKKTTTQKSDDDDCVVRSHRIVATDENEVSVLVVPAGAPAPRGCSRLASQTLVEEYGAHTPYFRQDSLPTVDCFFEGPCDAEGRVVDAPRFPFFSNGRVRANPSLLDTLIEPVDWFQTCRAMADAGAADFLEVGQSTRLQSFLPFILPEASSSTVLSTVAPSTTTTTTSARGDATTELE